MIYRYIYRIWEIAWTTYGVSKAFFNVDFIFKILITGNDKLLARPLKIIVEGKLSLTFSTLK